MMAWLISLSSDCVVSTERPYDMTDAELVALVLDYIEGEAPDFSMLTRLELLTIRGTLKRENHCKVIV